MRDPYHNARLRFKVARDRYINTRLSFEAGKWDIDIKHHELRRKYTLAYCANLQPDMWWHGTGIVEAAGILHTMLRFKITDEKQAHMLWKLSRD